MLSFCRSGLLALTLMSGSIADAQAQPVQRISHIDWVSDVSIERLQDKSVLTEYFGEGASNKYKDITFRVGFIPRFGCAPLITFTFAGESVTSVQSNIDASKFPTDLSRLDIEIDGARMAFPALLDDNRDHHSVYMNADLQRRITARLRIEVGNRMSVLLRNGKRLNFSLMGSRDAISIANQNCRRHDPSIQG